MSNPETLQHQESLDYSPTAAPEQTRVQELLYKGRQLLGRLALTLSLATGGGVVIATGESTLNQKTAHATEFINDYPNLNASPYNPSEYEWWIDENGNGVANVTGELLSSRGYYYRNCTDGAAYWTSKYTGVNVAGWKDANKWDTGAAAAGFAVYPGNTNNIEPGDIAQSDDGNFGHVGFVTSVNKNSSGSIISFTAAELNKSGNGEYSLTTYSARNGSGNFIRYGSNDWDHFIDVNGVNTGLNNEPLTGNNPTNPTIIRVPVAGNFDGAHGEDLLASSKRSDAAPNLINFLSTGGWLGGSNLWSAPGEIRWADARLTVGDLDADGKSDLFAIQSQSDGHPNIYWLRSRGSSFAPPQLVGVPGLWFNDVREWVSGDFSGDGHADLLAVSKRGDAAPNLVVFPSTGNWLGASALWGAPEELRWADVRVIPADLDNDGKTDLLSVQPDSNGNPNIWWSRSTGTSFETPRLVGVPGLNFHHINNWIAGDFTGDGHDDLLASSKRGDAAPNMIVFPSTGGWLGGGALWGAPGQINWANARMVPADLNGDGKTDVLSIQPNGNNNPNIYWSRSTGSSFATPQLVGVPGLVASNVRWQQ